MRRGGLDAGRKQRHDGRIVAADALRAADAGVIDLGDEIAFAHADLDPVEDALVHLLDDARSIAQALWHSAALWRRDAVLEWGVYHFAGQPAVSWHEFAVEIFRQARESGLLVHIPRVRPITSQEYPTPARRPLWSVLDCSKGRARLGLELASWQEELRLVLAELPS